MTALPQGYEPHEIPADYTGPLFLEGQMRALAETETARLREAARMALEALVYHREQTRPIHSTDEAIDALREALGDAA